MTLVSIVTTIHMKLKSIIVTTIEKLFLIVMTAIIWKRQVQTKNTIVLIREYDANSLCSTKHDRLPQTFLYFVSLQAERKGNLKCLAWLELLNSFIKKSVTTRIEGNFVKEYRPNINGNF